MAKAKKYQDLTPAGQKRRLAKYAKEHAANGTQETTARIVREAVIKEIQGGNKQAIFRFAIHEKDTGETHFKTMKAFIAKGSEALESFYASLTPKHLLSVTFKESNGHLNVWRVMDRTEAYKANKAAKANSTPGTKEEPQEEAPLEV
ncbi:hypothetical protein ASD24_24800 [Paenibacillus sp. Root52]|uniref:hypothetical protein n=1 Tax=Paenibacillus sp. Root52 TaxID=1736552 RepID=UPI0006FBF613|nr:hypothetical protein [Paenibacillus sp. Root52]KQY91018.1 hypothetical protein ASD24_24800 [Paenibacillus sp. Root52]